MGGNKGHYKYKVYISQRKTLIAWIQITLKKQTQQFQAIHSISSSQQ